MHSEFEVKFTVDWISATVAPEEAPTLLKGLYQNDTPARIQAVPSRGYNQAFEYSGGLRVNWHSTNEEMGVHFVLSGSCLRYFYSTGLDWYELSRIIDKSGGRTSRVDLAFDVKNSKLTSSDLCKPNLRPYKGRGRTPKFTEVLGGDGSWTKYIGSRSSEKFLRVYDKAKEQGDYVGDYVRIELETKGEIGHAVGWNFSRISKDECVGMARQLVLAVADFNLEAWDAALRGDVVDFTLPQGRERDTFGWLVNVCAPALAKEIARRPKDPVLDQFWDALREALLQRGIETNSEQLDAQ